MPKSLTDQAEPQVPTALGAIPSREAMVARAEMLVPSLLARQAETEELTYYPASTHQDLLDGGFYRILVPRRFSGYELDCVTFIRVLIALASGCPSTAWSYGLPAGHALMIGAWFAPDTQAELFGDGEFLCAAVADPRTVARRTADGWILSGTQAYASGSPYATHFMGQALVHGDGSDPVAPRPLLYIVPRRDWTRLDDWNDALGLRGSGSHSIRLDDVTIPARFAIENLSMVDVDVSAGTIGARLHANPMYALPTVGYFQAHVSAIVVGAAKGALVEYERIIRERTTQRPPRVRRSDDEAYQRWFGLAIGRISTAEAALVQCAEEIMRLSERSVLHDEPFSRADDLRIALIAREAMAIAWDAMNDHVFRTAGSSAARHGERMERLFRDMAMMWTHFTNVLTDWVATELARERLGRAVDNSRESARAEG
jgi:3-hydroxy-9,10-secoandrosta-1,3,5(10)-triene-9,17-dione monooxygenase